MDHGLTFLMRLALVKDEIYRRSSIKGGIYQPLSCLIEPNTFSSIVLNKITVHLTGKEIIRTSLTVSNVTIDDFLNRLTLESVNDDMLRALELYFIH